MTDIESFAGPGAASAKPGLVHFAHVGHGHATLHREAHFGDIGRWADPLACLRTAIALLEEMLP